MSMNVIFDNILERDMDMLLMRQFHENNASFIALFLNRIHYDSDYSVLKIAHLEDLTLNHIDLSLLNQVFLLYREYYYDE